MTKVYQVSFKHFYLIGVYFETLGRHLIGLNQTVKTAVIQNYAWFEQKLTWLIEHCANVTEDTYIVRLGAWNPLDGWILLDGSKNFCFRKMLHLFGDIKKLLRQRAVCIDDFIFQLHYKVL